MSVFNPLLVIFLELSKYRGREYWILAIFDSELLKQLTLDQFLVVPMLEFMTPWQDLQQGNQLAYLEVKN